MDVCRLTNRCQREEEERERARKRTEVPQWEYESMKRICVRKTERKIFNLHTYFFHKFILCFHVSVCIRSLSIFRYNLNIIHASCFMHKNPIWISKSHFCTLEYSQFAHTLTNLCGSDAAAAHKMNTVWRISIWDTTISPEIIYAVFSFDFRYKFFEHLHSFSVGKLVAIQSNMGEWNQ